MHMVILDNDENTEFRPFAIAIQIEDLSDLAELVKRFGLSTITVNNKYRATGKKPRGNTDRVEIVAIWRYLEAKYRVFEANQELNRDGDVRKRRGRPRKIIRDGNLMS